VGYLAKVCRTFAAHKGVKEGDLMFLEHYVPCGHCEWDHMGEYRHCAATEWFYDPKAIRYGYTSIEIPPSLWGGFSEYLYLPLNAVLHKVPAGLTPEQAGLGTPMSNGIQWTLIDSGVGYGSTVLVQGPGQQGLCCVMAAKHAGAERVIVTGTSSDVRRLEVAKALGADEVIDYTAEDFTERGQRYDVLFDIGANRSFADCRRVLAPNGTLLLVGAPSGLWAQLSRVLMAQLSREGSKRIAYIARIRREDLVVLKELVEAGKLSPVIDRQYRLNEVPDALRYLGARHARGKVVINVDG